MRLAALGLLGLGLCLAPARLAFAATDATSLDRIEFQRRANAVCATYTRKIAALGPVTTPASVDRWATLMRAQTRALAALRPPTVYTIRYRRFVAVSRAVLPVALEALEAKRAGDAARSKRLSEQATRLANERSRIADNIGLRTCAKQ